MIKKILLYFLCYFCVFCQPQVAQQPTARQYVSLNPKTQNVIDQKYLFEDDKEVADRPPVSPSKLKISNLQVSLVTVGNNIYPKINFKRSELSDYAEYQICLDEINCKTTEQTVSLEAILAQKVDGFFIINVKACVYKERSTDQNAQCGNIEEVPGQIDMGAANVDLHSLIKQKMEYEEEIKAEGENLLAIIKKYEEDIAVCREKYKDLKVSLSDIVIANLKKWGVLFIGEALISLNSSEPSSEEDQGNSSPSEKMQPDRGNINNILFGVMGVSAGVLAYVAISADPPSAPKQPDVGTSAAKATSFDPPKASFFSKHKGKFLKGMGALGVMAGVAMAVIAIHDETVYGLTDGESIDPRCPANKEVVLNLKELGEKVQGINTLKAENDAKIDALATEATD